MSFPGATSFWDCYTTPRASYHPATQTVNVSPFAPSPDAPFIQALRPPSRVRTAEASTDVIDIVLLLCTLTVSVLFLLRYRYNRSRRYEESSSISSKHPNDPDYHRRQDGETT
jgi:hypothetical protein